MRACQCDLAEPMLSYIPPGEAWMIVRTAVAGFLDDNALSRAAAMAFYAATSLAPILLIVIAIAGLVVGHDAAELAVSAQLSGLLGPQGADLLKSVVQGASNSTSGIVAASIALLTLLVSASGVFGEMQAALNKIWKVESVSTTLSALVRARAASLGLVASLGFLLLVSLVASAAISGLGEHINSYLPFGALILALINTIVSLSLIAVLFGAIYKILPDRSLTWRDIRFGAITTAILFTAGKSLIGWYLGTSAVASSYGAAGSLIVLLLWVFYSSAIFLFGAEVTRAHTTSFGTRENLSAKVHTGTEDRIAPSIPVKSGGRAPLAIAAIAFVSALTASLVSRAVGRRTRGK
jgi:membrane protein